MAVKIINEDKDKITLEIDNGDFEKMKQAKEKWNFNSYQSFLRFVSSILLDSKDTTIYIHSDSGPVRVIPASHLLATDLKKEEQK